ncbi:hypothetical protein GGX14DRAFT_394583 [Mycena pura]|uniref:Uncharacterized protein n=1 Tax=Mycena pura TaxID=153505 RepID=A0AAD6YBP9_9AGAR|nr:hypothetical protein GGX14DRAFT_394583 [Mycena pura]
MIPDGPGLGVLRVQNAGSWTSLVLYTTYKFSKSGWIFLFGNPASNGNLGNVLFGSPASKGFSPSAGIKVDMPSYLFSTGWTQEHKYVPFACCTGYLGGQEIFVAVLVFNSDLTGDDENTNLNDPDKPFVPHILESGSFRELEFNGIVAVNITGLTKICSEMQAAIGMEDILLTKIQAPPLMAEGFPNKQLAGVLGKVGFPLKAGFPNRIIQSGSPVILDFPMGPKCICRSSTVLDLQFSEIHLYLMDKLNLNPSWIRTNVVPPTRLLVLGFIFMISKMPSHRLQQLSSG